MKGPLPTLIAAGLLTATILSSGAAHALAAPSSHPARNHAHVNVPVLGWYTGGNSESNGTNLATYGQTGMNLVVAPNMNDDAALHTFLGRARNAGIRVLVAPNDGWVVDSNWTALAAFIREFKDDPTVYGWYLFDEPDFNNLPAPQLDRAYQVVKSVDRAHPVAVVFTLGQCRFGRHLDRRYLRGFDLLMCDDYPFYTFVRSHSQSLAAIREFQSTTRHCVYTARHFHKLGPIMVAQGFGNGVKDGPFMFRDPTFAEQKAMFHDAVAAGAKGILYFNDDQADKAVKASVRTIVTGWYRTLPSQYRPHPVPAKPAPAPAQPAPNPSYGVPAKEHNQPAPPPALTDILDWHCPAGRGLSVGCAA
jgi:hypothetical protein